MLIRLHFKLSGQKNSLCTPLPLGNLSLLDLPTPRNFCDPPWGIQIFSGITQCFILTLVTQNNRPTFFFDEPIPKVYFMKLLSYSLYNSWDMLRNEGSAGLRDEKKINWYLLVKYLKGITLKNISQKKWKQFSTYINIH